MHGAEVDRAEVTSRTTVPLMEAALWVCISITKFSHARSLSVRIVQRGYFENSVSTTILDVSNR